ncbi:MAG: hypothetical protein QXP80_05415 [Zestosphaera sp.]
MNVINDEVFAVIMALVILGSVLTTATMLRPEVTEPFTAIGLLNSECRIGDYPWYVIAGGKTDLCVYVFNYMGYPILAQVRYKVGTASDLPTNNTPSVLRSLENLTAVIAHNSENLIKVSLPVVVDESLIGKNASLILELWVYDVSKGVWVYSGRWAHLHVRVIGVPIS